MKRAAGIALLVAAALVQVTAAPRFAVGGGFPNLVLLFAVCATWNLGVRSGMAWACAGGIALDLMSPGPVGPHALAVLAAAYVAGFWKRNVGPHEAAHAAVAAAVGTAVYSLVVVASGALTHMPVPSPGVSAQLVGMSAAYNAALMPPAFAMARRLAPARHAERGIA